MVGSRVLVSIIWTQYKKNCLLLKKKILETKKSVSYKLIKNFKKFYLNLNELFKNLGRR